MIDDTPMVTDFLPSFGRTNAAFMLTNLIDDVSDAEKAASNAG